METKKEFKSYEDFAANYKLNVPENYNFSFDCLDVLAQDPERPAMIHIDPEGSRHEYSFGFFREQSCRMANALSERGVKKGDRIMLILYRRVEFWTAMLALHRLGAVPIPSPSLLTEKDIRERVNYANIRAIICEDSICERVDKARVDCPSLANLVQVDGELNAGWESWDALMESGSPEFARPAECPGGDDPFLIFFSSGTTGMPKMVLHNHTYPYSHYTTAAYWHDLEPGDIHLTLSDTGWGKCVWGKFYGQWMAGAVVFVWDFRGKFVPAELLELLAAHKVTTFCAPPTVYRFLVREDLKKYDLSSLRHCTTAGELLNDSVFYAWREATGLPLYEGYGQTETTLQVATFKFMEPRPSSIGRPVPGWEIALLGEDGKPVPRGEEGEICIKLHTDSGNNGVLGLFDSYLDEPEKTAAAKVDGYYHTGDKVWEDEEGFFWFMGRTDDLIKSSGYRVGPFEVESALVSHDAVVEAAVTGVPDPVRGQAIKATLVLAPGYDGSDELTKELQDHVKKITAPYKYPRIIEYVAELPKTISGKIKRAEIRKEDESKYN
ncbi:AMP-binding protein [Salidesulfovibrio onnuriiensis]|uniref:AMP-binding protein n=1 Tax=Salidesulfovibrio onnuriiensis TaxID=2583823 RepID=UPI0011C94395|nr:AMP-binding protein [Salidesulfovibrio onnuriiensis]